MSEENIELAHRALDVLRRGDSDGAARCFHPDAEWHNTPAFPGQRIIIGPEAIIDFTKDLWASFATEGSRGEVERVRTMGDCVVLGVHSQGRGKGSGVPVDVHWAITLTVRDGKIARADVRGDYAKAIEAAGIGQ